MGTNSSTESRPRVFWTYWAALTTSNLGSAVTSVALPLTAVSVLQASAFEVGLLAAASYAAWLVIGLPAGVLVQRLPLRGTQVATDLARAVAIGSVPLAWWWDQLDVTHLVVVALVIGFATVVFDVGTMTMLPTLVRPAELTARNSFVSGTYATTQLGGPSLGGLLVQVLGPVPTLLADTASYLCSAVLMSRLPRRDQPRSADPAPVRVLIRDGLRFVTRHPVMAPCMWGATAVNFVCGALLALAPLYLVRELGAPPAVVGLLIATEGVGALVGASVAPWLARRIGTARSVLAASMAGAAASLAMPAGSGVSGMVLFALGNAGFGAAVVVFSIHTRTHRQTASPPELLSRVMATVRFVSWGAIPIGSVAAGAVATWLGIRPALWLVCACAFAPVALLALGPVGGRRDLGT